MTKFSIGAPELNERTASTFAEFVSVAKGRSIVSAADWGDGRLELGLSAGRLHEGIVAQCAMSPNSFSR